MVLIGAQTNFGEFMGKFLRASMNLIRNYLNGSRVQVLTIMTVTNDATGLNLPRPSEPSGLGWGVMPNKIWWIKPVSRLCPPLYFLTLGYSDLPTVLPAPKKLSQANDAV